MKAVILAAGKGPRMLPLTKETPKSLLKVNEKTILETQIENLKKEGIEEIIIVTGHLAEKIEIFCKNHKIKTIFNPFYEISGMAMTLWIAKEELKEGFLFLYADILFNSKIIKELLKVEGEINLAIKKNDLREEAEKVIEEEGIIKNISKIKTSRENGEFIGLAKFSVSGAKKLIDELNCAARTNLNASFISLIDSLIKKGEIIKSYNIKDSQCMDIDFPEDLEKAKGLFNFNKV